MKLNEAQSKAVSHVDGPMMVIAGPGSGKTTVITKRIKYLIESAGVSPADILVITFTRAAAPFLCRPVFPFRYPFLAAV